MENKLVELLKSRKFWAAIAGLLVVFLGDRAGISPDRLTEAVVLIVSYILGTAVEDRARARG